MTPGPEAHLGGQSGSGEVPDGFDLELGAAFSPLGVHLPDLEASERVARLFGEGLAPGDLILLRGPLGAGKTLWVREACVARGIAPDEVTSPTYTLVHYYQGSTPVVHADLYRIGAQVLPEELGFDEELESETALVFVEWPDRLVGAQARRTIEVLLEIRDDGGRTVHLRMRERE